MCFPFVPSSEVQSGGTPGCRPVIPKRSIKFLEKASVSHFEIEEDNDFRHYSSHLNYGKVGSINAPISRLNKHVSRLAYAYAVSQRLRQCSDGSVPVWPVVWNLADNSAIVYSFEDENWAKVPEQGTLYTLGKA